MGKGIAPQYMEAGFRVEYQLKRGSMFPLPPVSDGA